MAVSLSIDQAEALSPDAASTKRAKKLASARHWPELGQNDRAIWGQCKGSSVYEVQIDLGGPAFKCSCPSRKHPCKHALALLLLFAGEPASLPETDAPDWVAEWLGTRAERAEQQAEKAKAKKKKIADPKAQAKRAAAREKKVAAGAEELELWLRDMVRGGLAAVQGREWDYWSDMARRMIDAQAKGLSRRVTELNETANSGDGWQERLLERICRLYLLIQAYKRRDELAPNLRAETLDQIGFEHKRDEALAGEGVADRWNVLGMAIDLLENEVRAQRVWLSGEKTGMAGLILHFAAFGQPLDTSLIPGTAFDGKLVFYPGARPERALVKERDGEAMPLSTFGGCLGDFGQAWAEALAADPWTERLPVALEDVTAARRGNKWIVRDEAGRAITLSPRFSKGWEVLAASGGRPSGSSASGIDLDPMSAWIEERFIALGEAAC